MLLDHVVTKNGIRLDTMMVKAIQKWKWPSTIKKLWSFFGLAKCYQHFILESSNVSRPLSNLFKKGESQAWDEPCHQAFGELKRKLFLPPILKFPKV